MYTLQGSELFVRGPASFWHDETNPFTELHVDLSPECQRGTIYKSVFIANNPIGHPTIDFFGGGFGVPHWCVSIRGRLRHRPPRRPSPHRAARSSRARSVASLDPHGGRAPRHSTTLVTTLVHAQAVLCCCSPRVSQLRCSNVSHIQTLATSSQHTFDSMLCSE